jgi:methylated-DNA-[protein]-cysteine S-methyltransferase
MARFILFAGLAMTNRGLALFETAIGWCGIAWSEAGLAGVQLAEGDQARTRARLARRFPDATFAEPPPEVASAMSRIARLLFGERDDLVDIRLDLSATDAFDQSVYHAAREVAPGQVTTYGAIATRLGDAGAARAVGQALGANPFPIVVPCHRVVAAGGRIGGFSAHGGIATKRRLLEIEGARFGDEPDLFDPR